MTAVLTPTAASARPVTIYALCEPHSGNVRYVGKTVCTPEQRLTAHVRAAKYHRAHLPSAMWVREQLDSGLRPVVVELERVSQDADWAAQECYWIAFYRARGADLLNLTDGGEGCAGHKQTAEHRRKIRAKVIKGSQFQCEQCPRVFWRKPSAIKEGDCRFCSRKCYHAATNGVSKPFPAATHSRGVATAAMARRARTHCKRGHPLSGENLRIYGSSRSCRKCSRLAEIRYREKSR